MQKKIIALAVAALASSAAFAQTNVTIYGIADLGQTYVAVSGNGTSDASVMRLDTNSSYLGFKGVEDLGNGLKAVFQFETGLNADNGNGSTSTNFGVGRDTYVGLTGGFGTVLMGNLTHPLRNMGAKVDLMPGATGVGLTMSVTGKVLGQNTGADDRSKNTVAYVTPSFGGFTVTAAYINSGHANDETRTTTGTANAEPRAYQLAAQYDNGPIYAGIGYHRSMDLGVTRGNLTSSTAALSTSGDDNAAVIRAAAVYTFPTQTKITALWDNTRITDTASAGDYSRNAYSLGVAQGFGKSTIGLQYGRSDNTKGPNGTISDSSSNIISAIYSYSLSKRTMIHARASRLNNSDAVNNNFYVNPVANSLTTTNGADYTGVMVGLRHAF